MDLEQTFSFDKLTVSFGAKLAKHNGVTVKAPLDLAVQEINSIIWQQGGFRFIHKFTNSNMAYYYYCSQDKAIEKVTSQKDRDVPRMERFDCQSKLKIRPCLENRALFLSMRHNHHNTYVDKQLSTAVLEFIRERIESSSPAEIFRDLQAAAIQGSDLATEHQVYYRYIHRFRWLLIINLNTYNNNTGGNKRIHHYGDMTLTNLLRQ